MEISWEEKRGKLNELHRELEMKPEIAKKGFNADPGSILNAYREADISFTEAIYHLDKYYGAHKECIEISPKQFYHLHSLCQALVACAERDEAANASIVVAGVGTIGWRENGKVLITLEGD